MVVARLPGRRILAGLVLAALTAALLLRGVFPRPYAVTWAAAVLAGFTVWRVADRRPGPPADGVTVAAAAWLAASLAAWAGAASLNQAVIGTLLLAAGWAVYWASRRAFAGPDGLILLLLGLAGAATVADLVGWVGLVHPAGLFSRLVDPVTGRLNGVLEYPNASAILAVIGGLAAWQAETLWPRGRAGSRWAGAIAVATLLRTASVGAALVGLIATAVVLIQAPRRWPTVVGSLLAGLAAGLLLGPSPGRVIGALAAVAAAAPLAAACAWWGTRPRPVRWGSALILLALLAGSVAGAMSRPIPVTPRQAVPTTLPAGATRIAVRTTGPATLQLWTAQGSLAAQGRAPGSLRVPPGATTLVITARQPTSLTTATATVAGHTVPLRFWAAHLLPGPLYGHWQELRQSAYDWISRWSMVQDGGRMIAARPIRGWGGGGWAAAYAGFQRWPYVSAEPHDSVIQIGVETGLWGVAAWVGVLVGVVRAWRRARSPAADAVLLVLAVFWAHTLLDWDWAYPSLQALAFAVMGALTGQAPPDPDRVPIWRAPAALAGVGALVAGSIAVGQWFGAAGDAVLARGAPLTAAPLYAQALRFDPLSAAFHDDVAQIDQTLGVVSPAAAAAAAQAYAAAVRLAPTNPVYWGEAGLFWARADRVGAALAAFAQAVRWAPRTAAVYALAVSADEGLGYAALARGDRAAARAPLRAALATAQAWTHAAQTQPAAVPPADRMPPPSPAGRLYAGLAALLLRDPTAAAHWLPPSPAGLSPHDQVAWRVATAAVRRAAGRPGWRALIAGHPAAWRAFQRALRAAAAPAPPAADNS